MVNKADARIGMNIKAPAIRGRVDNAELFAESPPRRSARQRTPLILAILFSAVAFVGCQVTPQQGGISEITARELRERLTSHAPVILVFACPGATFPKARIGGAISVEEFRRSIPSLPRDAEIILYCACAGDKAAHALAAELSSAGFTTVSILPGGIYTWIREGFDLAPLEPVSLLPIHSSK